MKWLFPLFLLFVYAFALPCDEQVYAWEKQTANDERFTQFPKITGKRNGPVYPGGDKALDALIREKLVVSEEALGHNFILNYYAEIRCDGSVGEITVLGDPVVKDWTNIENILRHTTGWKSAIFNNQPVNCIYFRTFAIDGKAYKNKLMK